MPSNLDVKIHPQSVLVITDNISRKPYLTNGNKYLCGVILGSCENGVIEVLSSVEVPSITSDDGTLTIDKEFYNEMINDRIKVNPMETPIGWFTCEKYDDDVIAQLDKEFKVIDGMECLVRIEFDQNDSQMLKIFVNNNNEYTQVDYNYDLDLSERIALLQLQKGDDSESQIKYTKDAYASMNENLGKVEKYLSDVCNGQCEFDAVLVRDCATLARWFEFKDDETENELDVIEEQSELGLMATMMVEVLAKIPN